VFDNDGTLWCEKPMPIQLDFILRRLVVMVDQDPALRTRQPSLALEVGLRQVGRAIPHRGCINPANALLISSPCAVHRPRSRNLIRPASRPDLAAVQEFRLGNPMAPDRKSDSFRSRMRIVSWLEWPGGLDLVWSRAGGTCPWAP
jgi:hypothetical protein